MPLVTSSSYRAPLIFQNNHLNTIYPALFRKIKGIQYERERLYTPDQDFIDLDWSIQGNKQLLIALHGLEGSADRDHRALQMDCQSVWEECSVSKQCDQRDPVWSESQCVQPSGHSRASGGVWRRPFCTLYLLRLCCEIDHGAAQRFLLSA